MSFGERPINLNRFRGGSLRFGNELSWVSEHNCEDRVTISQSGIDLGVARIFPDCALEIVNGFAHMFLGSLIPVVDAQQIVVIRLVVDWTGAGQTRLFGRCDLSVNLAGDRARDFALHPQRVAKVALIAFGPQLPVGARMDQSSADAHTVA